MVRILHAIHVRSYPPTQKANWPTQTSNLWKCQHLQMRDSELMFHCCQNPQDHHDAEVGKPQT